jgi:hypothetical protein
MEKLTAPATGKGWSDWTADELDRIGGSTELQVAPAQEDGSPSRFTTIWVVRVGADLYVRSARGVDNPWFRRASTSGVGRVRAGGIERDVTFASVGDDSQADIDAAYHAKYDHYGAAIVGSVVGAHAYPGTLRLIPRP